MEEHGGARITLSNVYKEVWFVHIMSSSACASAPRCDRLSRLHPEAWRCKCGKELSTYCYINYGRLY
jgi:hypothetical protein